VSRPRPALWTHRERRELLRCRAIADPTRLNLFDDGHRVAREAISVRPESGAALDAGFIELRPAELLAAPTSKMRG
jgi:hypothetical protein